MPARTLATLVLASTLAACSSGEAPSAARGPGTDLATVTVVAAPVPRETAFDGVVEAVNQSTVSAQTSGRVMELPFDVGDYVAKGAVIARLRDTEQRARVGSASGALAEAEARLREATLAHTRAKELLERGLVARAALDTAAANLGSAEARVAAARASVTEAEEGASNTVIRAPYAGMVVARHLSLGESVTPGQRVMTGLSLEHLRVVVEVPQQHIGPLRKHRQARVLLPDGHAVLTRELRIPPSADPVTHTFRVQVSLPVGEHGLFPGTLAKVAFTRGEDERLLIPASALARRGELTAAYVVDDAGGVMFRYLRVASPTADGRIPVLAGLSAGERVATDPVAAAAAYKARAETGE
jgi:RND family efflux transporter MFP subunit